MALGEHIIREMKVTFFAATQHVMLAKNRFKTEHPAVIRTS